MNSRGRGELITLLQHRGADAHKRNNAKQTPIGLARLIRDHDVVQFFSDPPGQSVTVSSREASDVVA